VHTNSTIITTNINNILTINNIIINNTNTNIKSTFNTNFQSMDPLEEMLAVNHTSLRIRAKEIGFSKDLTHRQLIILAWREVETFPGCLGVVTCREPWVVWISVALLAVQTSVGLLTSVDLLAVLISVVLSFNTWIEAAFLHEVSEASHQLFPISSSIKEPKGSTKALRKSNETWARIELLDQDGMHPELAVLAVLHS
jgi:hypothetical protein